MKHAFPFVALSLLALSIAASPAQEKKKEKKVDPTITVIVPLGADLGRTTKLTIRGLRLDQAKEVQVSGGGKAKIVSKGAAPVPDKNPDKVGDTQIVAEVTLPDKAPEGGFQISVTLPDGTTKPHDLLVEARVFQEKEPNPGFKQSQDVKVPSVIEGAIGSPRDVDVYRFEARTGRDMRISIRAARHGSPLDAMLLLYNHSGALLASAAGTKGSPDAVLEFTPPADGVYHLAVLDAHDAGSAIHVYRLSFE